MKANETEFQRFELKDVVDNAAGSSSAWLVLLPDEKKLAPDPQGRSYKDRQFVNVWKHILLPQMKACLIENRKKTHRPHAKWCITLDG